MAMDAQSVTVADVAKALPEGRMRVLCGTSPVRLTLERVAAVQDAGPAAVSFLTASAAGRIRIDPQAAPTLLLLDSDAAVDDAELAAAGVAVVIRVDNARLAFIRVAKRFFAAQPPAEVHPSAVIAPGARVAVGVAVGPLCTVGEGCELGEGTRLDAGVHLFPGVRIGKNVRIQAGAVIGAEGFGLERDPDGHLERFPHFGTVEIGDDVEIGANTCIDRGALGPTRIGRGTRIDNLVHVGHNVEIGEDTVVVALAIIGGSSRIGSRAWIGPAACIRDNVSIGDGATVGMGAVVTRDVPPGTTVAGNPARPFAEHVALMSHFRDLVEARGPTTSR